MLGYVLQWPAGDVLMRGSHAVDVSPRGSLPHRPRERRPAGHDWMAMGHEHKTWTKEIEIKKRLENGRLGSQLINERKITTTTTTTPNAIFLFLKNESPDASQQRFCVQRIPKRTKIARGNRVPHHSRGCQRMQCVGMRLRAWHVEGDLDDCIQNVRKN
jgi:hypothetical protein